MAGARTVTTVAPELERATETARELIRAASTGRPPRSVVPVGAGTDAEVGNPVVAAGGTPAIVRAPAGVVRHDVADMTVTVGGGTSCAELDEVLSLAGQECPLDPRTADATVGGVLAAGLSGPRRLRLGPVREWVLEVRFMTADGRLVLGGGPTVKNVSGYDLPRLLVGSLGTLGLIVQVTLRCRPRSKSSVWAVREGSPDGLRDVLFAPSSLLWDGRRVHVLLEGHPVDIDAQLAAGALQPAGAAPAWPAGPHRGRVSVPPGSVVSLGAALRSIEGCGWLSEIGVGTVHVACDTQAGLRDARDAAHAVGGWLLREAGATALDGFGRALPNIEVMRRIKKAFDPSGVLSPGRLPL